MKTQHWLEERRSGLLLHPTSLPGPHGIGDLGPSAFSFVDYLASASQTAWQMLPVVPPGRSFSPYDGGSAFATSPWLVSLDSLQEDGLLTRAETMTRASTPARRGTPGASDSPSLWTPPKGSFPRSVDFKASASFKFPRLRRAFERAEDLPKWRQRMDEYLEREGDWLHDAALFFALKDLFRNKSWTKWDAGLRLRRKSALREARKEQDRRFRYQVFVQYVLDRQWNRLRDYARQNGVSLIGDVPIYVALESGDVWSRPHLFDLNRQGRPRSVAGVPPDYFNRNGQRWGNPTYDWDQHRKEGFAWWTARMSRTLELFDTVRLDHFIGFHRYWEVPATSKTARRGVWKPGPGRALFDALFQARTPVPLIAEDLGIMTPEVHELRDTLGFRGVRVLQCAFDGDQENIHLPHNLPRQCVAYTGTHDNKTTTEWARQTKPDAERRRVADIKRERKFATRYLKCADRELPDAIMQALFATVADSVIVPVQDVLGLGGTARMNRPGTARGNWTWRLQPKELTSASARRLRELTELYGRDPSQGRKESK